MRDSLYLFFKTVYLGDLTRFRGERSSSEEKQKYTVKFPSGSSLMKRKLYGCQGEAVPSPNGEIKKETEDTCKSAQPCQ